MTSAPWRQAVAFRRVTRRFGDVTALHELDLDIREGEFFAILGPSGSGKTTCLRLIAGFDRPTSGSIDLHGEPAQALPVRAVGRRSPELRVPMEEPHSDRRHQGKVGHVPLLRGIRGLVREVALHHVQHPAKERGATVAVLFQGEIGDRVTVDGDAGACVIESRGAVLDGVA